MEFTVAVFNAHWGVGRFGAQRGVRFDVASVVRGFEADVVVVCEAWRWRGSERSMFDDFADDGWHVEDLPFTTLDFEPRPHHAEPGLGLWSLAVLTRLPVLRRSVLPIGSVRGDPAGPRNALRLELDAGGIHVDFVAVHPSSRLYLLASPRQLRALAGQLPRDGRPAVVAGDCNLWGPALALVMRGWRRTVRGRTYPAHGPHSQIDHVLVRGGARFLAGEVLPSTPSDHRPIRARLRVGR